MWVLVTTEPSPQPSSLNVTVTKHPRGQNNPMSLNKWRMKDTVVRSNRIVFSLNKKEGLSYVTTWAILEDMLLSKKPQRDKYCLVTSFKKETSQKQRE